MYNLKFVWYNAQIINKDRRQMNTLDKSQIPTCDILGTQIAAINMKRLLEFTDEHIHELSGNYMCVSNVHTAMLAFNDEEYRKIQNDGIMAIPDGGPLAALGRKCGYTDMERTTGPDYMAEIFKISVEKGYRHYFYGSTEETLQKLEQKITERYPGIQIVGMYSPPFRELTEEEDEKVICSINEARPDFVWVGLGAPKQEQWMAGHKSVISGFMVGVGAGFDYFAGNIKRAPRWMQERSLEWVYRLLQEPKRLFGRYLVTNTKFIWYTRIRGNKKCKK